MLFKLANRMQRGFELIDKQLINKTSPASLLKQATQNFRKDM